jgi:hypothetical protein
MPTKKPILFVVAMSLALALTACGPLPGADSETASPSPTADVSAPPTETPSAEPTSTPAERPTAETISCDTMLDPLVDRALRSTQLIPVGKAWTQFGFEPSGAAIECPWGYAEQPHSVTYYAWASLSPGEGETFLALTADNGYTTTQDERGTWVVSPEGDADEISGILVTDEWIALAPTQELISAIVWTR